MNFLAHLVLAGPPAAPAYADILLGQFIADAVRGRQLESYPPGVQAGIRAHRAVDSFTDQHPVVRRTTARLRAAGLGKYAGVVADVFYDHLLAADFETYAPGAGPLPAFAARVYATLAARQAEMPAAVQRFFPFMVAHNWLVGYAAPAGIERALQGLSRRASPGSGMEAAGAELTRHYADYRADFEAFWPELSQLSVTSYQ